MPTIDDARALIVEELEFNAAVVDANIVCAADVKAAVDITVGTDSVCVVVIVVIDPV